MSEALRNQIKGTNDDSDWSQEMSEDAVKTFEKTFEIDEVELSRDEGAQEGWTGILGATFDRVPFVGAIPSLPGQFVIAGFNGHGMFI
jgi:glycine/D-amino acid oxidase-like deaminating enzyme